MSEATPLAVTYYPGCSLASTGRDYAESLAVMCERLGVELVELKDWTCCGASSGSLWLSHEAATALPALTLRQAAESQRPLFAPCAACYNRLKVAVRDLRREPELVKKLEATPEMLQVKVINTVELLRDVVGLERLRELVTVPLTGLQAAAYYGCLLLRPRDMEPFDDPEQPTSMEAVIEATGATAVTWYGRMDCCSAGLAGTMQEVAEDLVTRIVRQAKAAGAQAAITACQLCSMNLESRQGPVTPDADPLPILYLSDLVGLALGVTPGELGLSRHLVDVRSVLAATELADAGH
jgi:heterodisulfide reductase subunit B